MSCASFSRTPPSSPRQRLPPYLCGQHARLKQRFGGLASQVPSHVAQVASAPKPCFKCIDFPGDAINSPFDRLFLHRRRLFRAPKHDAVSVDRDDRNQVVNPFICVQKPDTLRRSKSITTEKSTIFSFLGWLATWFLGTSVVVNVPEHPNVRGAASVKVVESASTRATIQIITAFRFGPRRARGAQRP